QTPLNNQLHSREGLSIRELEPCSKITVRGNIADIAAAINGVTEMSADMPANTYTTNTAASLYWMGPDERMIHHTNADASALVLQLREKLPAGQSAVVDVSDYYTVIQLAGAKARASLASGTPFDVHPRVFTLGQCTQTRFGNASVLLSCKPDDTFDVQVRWSFAEYVWQYLCRVGSYV
ncbi:MAG: sarcosine oxidase subunit gamma family protein, partial [Pseudomonadota bacterium]